MRNTSRIIVGIACGVAGAVLALGVSSAFPTLTPFSQQEESHDTQVINAVDRIEEIALVSLGIQGIAESRASSKVFGIKVPGSDRATFIQYTFKGKLGIDGADVTVTPTGENSYRITIPEFIFVGYDDPVFKLAAEDNGVLSWVTADIDSLDTVNGILDDDAQRQYLDENVDVLKEQAQTFYRSIIRSVDPLIELEFEFAN